MFSFHKKKSEEKNDAEPVAPSPAQPIENTVPASVQEVPVQRPEDPHPFNEDTKNLLDQKICYIMKIKREPLFSWDDVPGKDSERFLGFVKEEVGISCLVSTAKIEKVDNGSSIILKTEKNYLSLGLNDEKTRVNLKSDNGRSAEFKAKNVNGKLNIYREWTYPDKAVAFDKVIKRRWRSQEVLGFPPEAMITEEEFWHAYIKINARNIVKQNASEILEASKEFDIRSAKIEEVGRRLDEASKKLLEAQNKIKILKEERGNIKAKSILRNQVFSFCEKEYKVTIREKKLLIELEKRKGWTTAKELMGGVQESETYVCQTLRHLKNRGLPIASNNESGKCFWMLIRNENRVDNTDIVKG